MKYLLNHQKLIDQMKVHHPNVISIKPNINHIREIGVLHLKTKSVKFISDHDYIFANGKAIAVCYNDHWTASAIFAETMQMVYGNKFISALGE